MGHLKEHSSYSTVIWLRTFGGRVLFARILQSAGPDIYFTLLLYFMLIIDREKNIVLYYFCKFLWHTNEEKVTQKACLCKCSCKCYEFLWRRLQFECMTTMWRHHYRWRVNVWRKRLSDIQGKSWYCQSLCCQNFVILYFPLYSIVYQFVL